MGFDLHSLHFLKEVSHLISMGEVITLGRQGIHADQSYIDKIFLKNNIKTNDFSEKLLTNNLGAKNVYSLDASNYQGCDILHDLNLPIDERLTEKYDTLIDGGTLEHIFNIPIALQNISKLVKLNGHILHMLPANNFCGHGFYQFSPELFYQYYSTPYFEIKRMYVIDTSKSDGWYIVKRPLPGVRLNIKSSSPIYVYCLVQKIQSQSNDYCIQQSDYLDAWENLDSNLLDESKNTDKFTRSHKIITQLKKIGLYNILKFIREYLGFSKSYISNSHPFLKWSKFKKN